MFSNFLNNLQNTFATTPTSAYGWVVAALLLAGIGLPLPEDIPLLLGGYACAQEGMPQDILGIHPVIVMMAAGILAILAGDLFVYCLGRFVGGRVHQWKWFMKLVGHGNLEMARTLCAKKGGRFIIVSRFMPGLRSPAFFAAGSLGMPVGKFLLCDGLAAMFSAPIFVFLGFHFHDKLDYAKDALKKGELIGFIILGVLVLVVVAYKMFITQKIKKMKAEAELADQQDQATLLAADKKIHTP